MLVSFGLFSWTNLIAQRNCLQSPAWRIYVQLPAFSDLGRERRLAVSSSSVRITSLLRPPQGNTQTGWFKQQKLICSQLWKLEVQDQGTSRVGLWFLAFRRPPSSYVLTWSSFRVYGESKFPGVFSSSLVGTAPIGLGLPPMTSFSLYYLLKGPASKYCHIRGWGFNM